MTRTVVIGDVQGHVGMFRNTLTDLGINLDTGHIPTDLVVVQAGDLIHKGPDSDEVVALADLLLTTSPQQWIQLVGNHEGQYLGGPVFWPTTIGDAAARTLATWLVEGRSRIAWSVESSSGQILISHGGLGLAKWIEIGRPASAVVAAQRLNLEFLSDPVAALTPGIMLHGEKGPPGAAWTEPVHELYEPWADHGDAPFDQVHGHSSILNWHSSRFWAGVPEWMRSTAEVDLTRRHTALTVAGRRFVGIDTAFGRHDGHQTLFAHPV